MKLEQSLDIKGQRVIFNESMGGDEYSQYSGKEFIVNEVYIDHATCSEKGGCDPISLPMIKITSVCDHNVTFNAYFDEIGHHEVIDLFISGLTAAKPLRNSYNNLPGSRGYDASKVKTLSDYKKEAEKLNPYPKGSSKHFVFSKGFESMFFK